MDYIHYNPVRDSYVYSPADWQYSSFRKCVDKGCSPEGWRATEPEIIKELDYE